MLKRLIIALLLSLALLLIAAAMIDTEVKIVVEERLKSNQITNVYNHVADIKRWQKWNTFVSDSKSVTKKEIKNIDGKITNVTIDDNQGNIVEIKLTELIEPNKVVAFYKYQLDKTTVENISTFYLSKADEGQIFVRWEYVGDYAPLIKFFPMRIFLLISNYFIKNEMQDSLENLSKQTR